MDITPLIPEGRQIVQSYAAGRFRVSGRVYDGGIVVFPDRVLPWTASPGDIGADDFSAVLGDVSAIDVVLMGCGAAMGAIPFPLRRALKDRGITVEFMDTGAACRTYNVLMAEGRRVAAVLLPA